MKWFSRSSCPEGYAAVFLLQDNSSVPTRSGLHIVSGTSTSKEDVEKAVSDTKGDAPQAFIVTLNARRESDSTFAKPIVPPRFTADAVVNVRKAMDRHSIRRLVAMTAFCVDDSFDDLDLVIKLVTRHTNMPRRFVDHKICWMK